MKDDGEKKAVNEKINVGWERFKLVAPYVFSLIILFAIFYFFPLKNKWFMFLSFIFFVFFSAFLLLGAGKFVELVFSFIYLPVYMIFLLLYWFLHGKDW